MCVCVCVCEVVGVLLVTLVCIKKDDEGLAKEIHVCVYVCEVVGSCVGDTSVRHKRLWRFG